MTSSTSNSSGTRTFANVLAVLMPVWILGGFFLLLDRVAFNDHADLVALWDKKVFENEPRVVVFGNSIAKRDVNAEILAEHLDIPKNKVTVLTVPDSGGSLWYAALKNRVYAQGVIPDMVIVVSDLSSVLGVEPLTEEDHRNLMVQLSDEEPLLSEKAFAGQSFRWLKLRQHRGDLRQYVLHTIRDYAVGGVFAQNKNKLALKGRAEVIPALDRVFQADNVDWDLHQRVIPIVEAPDYLGLPDLPSPRESLLPDIVKLANDHGSSFVFVRTPLAPGNTDDTHSPQKERDTVSLLNEMKAGYVDMRTLDLRDRHFEDRVHMNRSGSHLFTKAFASALVELGAMSSLELPPAVLPVTLRDIARNGTPPAPPSLGTVQEDSIFCRYEAPLNNPLQFDFERLGAAGLDDHSPFRLRNDGLPFEITPTLTDEPTCHNQAVLNNNTVVFSPKRTKNANSNALSFVNNLDLETSKRGFWIYPGTDVTLRFADAWDGSPELFTIKVTSEAFSAATGTPTIRYNEDEATPLPRSGNRHKLSLSPAPPNGEWSVTIASPADGPYLLLQGLVVGEGFGASTIIGTTADSRGVAIRLIGGMHTEGIKPVYPEEPPPLFTPEKIRRGNRMSALYKVPTFSYISDKATKNRTPFGNSCSPIRIAENDRIISSPHHTCVDVNARGRGRMCHQEDNIYFSASDNTYPGSNERTYELRLDTDRQCLRAWWLYPQDRLSSAHHRMSSPDSVMGSNASSLTRFGLRPTTSMSRSFE